MNILNGKIVEIKQSGALLLVKIENNNTLFTSIIIEDSEQNKQLEIGKNVRFSFKETEVIISKTSELKISLQNQIHCKVTAIAIGELLAEIILNFNQQLITSLITANACNQLGLQVNDDVVALIKTNEINIRTND
ncbi:MAG: TOBE domain-containing protein [Bacteroidia bacterium]|nr:hypothetical protein [Flavobacteriales bacterium]MBW7846411.1 TOBE domain-containing protein [Bacteroidia bacterium]